MDHKPNPDSAAPTLPVRDHQPGINSVPTTAEAQGQSASFNFLSPSQAADEIGRLGGYRVLRVLGQGGMGIVFQAEELQLRRLVALKAMLPSFVTDPTARQRFLREAQTAAALKHDHIVNVHAVGEANGAPFLAFEYLEGESLEARLQRECPLPIAEVVRIGRETADGLAAAHEHGLIHRDIKPANLWLEGERRRVKILDFGLARAAVDTGLTQAGTMVGTPAYMAPEQGRGEKVDFCCDLWSLGVVLYRLCTGQIPFQGKDTLSILSALALHTPAEPAKINKNVPARLNQLIMKLLAKEPAARPASARQVMNELRAIEQGMPVPSSHATDASRTEIASAPSLRVHTNKRRMLICAGLACALAIVAFVIVRALPSNDDSDKQPDKPKQDKPDETNQNTYINNLNMKFALIPKGKTWLGGGLDGREGYQEATIPHDFYLGTCEITQEQWEQLMGKNPSAFSRQGAAKDAVKDVTDEELKRFPVENISWHDVQEFLAVLNERDNKPGWLYRLPTEEEWEYACRNGPMTDKKQSAFDFYLTEPSNKLLPGQANVEHEGLKRPRAVGSYPPNRLGLHDMHGNVHEWCGANEKGTYFRGGCYSLGAGHARARERLNQGPAAKLGNLGFRVARVPQ